MKKIKFSKYFEKSFKKRILPNPRISKKFAERLKLFEINPRDPLIRDHALTGTKIGKRAFSITGDYRVVYGEKDGVLIFYDVGTHNQVY